LAALPAAPFRAILRQRLSEIALDPGDRGCRAPTAARFLDVCSALARPRLLQADRRAHASRRNPARSGDRPSIVLGVPAFAPTA